MIARKTLPAGIIYLPQGANHRIWWPDKMVWT